MRHKYALEFDVCGVPVELPIEYEYDYSPVERETPTYPGAPFELTVTAVWLEGEEVLDRLNDDQRERVRYKAMTFEGLV